MRRLFLVAPLVVLAALAALPRPTSEQLSARSLAELLTLPIDAVPGVKADADAPVLWQALLAGPAATPAANGGAPTLRLGAVHTDPTVARLAAREAGALLELEVDSPSGGKTPLWRALLAGPASRREGAGTVLRLNGCRHSADADAAPALEDTYTARLALGQALRELAASDPALGALTLEGEELPVRGGANFELVIDGRRHGLVVTFDGSDAPALRVERDWRPEASNDDEARASLVRGLRALAPALVIEGELEPALGGVDVLLENFSDRQGLVARAPGARSLRVHRDWTPTPARTTWPWMLGCAGLAFGALFLRARPQERRPTSTASRESSAAASDSAASP